MFMFMFMLVIAVFSVNMLMLVLVLFFLFLFIIIGVSSLGATHVEVVHVLGIPVLSHWLSLTFFILINPLGPVNLDMSGL